MSDEWLAGQGGEPSVALWAFWMGVEARDCGDLLNFAAPHETWVLPTAQGLETLCSGDRPLEAPWGLPACLQSSSFPSPQACVQASSQAQWLGLQMEVCAPPGPLLVSAQSVRRCSQQAWNKSGALTPPAGIIACGSLTQDPCRGEGG